MMELFLLTAAQTAACVAVMATGMKRKKKLHGGYLLVLAVVDFLLLMGINYLNPPALGMPFFGMAGRLTLVMALNLATALLWTLVTSDSYDDKQFGEFRLNDLWSWLSFLDSTAQGVERTAKERFSVARPLFVTVTFMLLIAGRYVIGTPLVQTEHYAKLIGTVEVKSDTKDFSPTDVKHIRMVSQEQAIWSGNKVLGNDGSIGSQFEPGNYSMQMVNGKLKWVAPLDFLSFSRWQSADGIPGYIMVDAEDSLAPAKLETHNQLDEKKFSFQYSPGAYFDKNLSRHIWLSGRTKYRIADTHFEIDDKHQPHWVVTLTLPSAGFGAQKIKEVLIIDPATGAIESFAPESVPEWVDRVVPEALAVNYIKCWGTYSPGWWSAFWSSINVKQPTGSDQEVAWLIYGKDGRAHWFTGMSSIANDQSLISVVTMDSRTGATVEYPMPGINEDAVIQAANSAVSNFEGYHGTAPVLYHISGENVWAVPVLSAEHRFQSLALVRAANGQVVNGVTKQDAVRALKNLLAIPGNSSVPAEEVKRTKLEVTIDRFSVDVKSGSSIYLIRAKERTDKIFVAQSEISSAVPLLQKGDRIEIEFFDSTDETLAISQLKVLSWAN